MTIIKITPRSNGAHDNQTCSTVIPVPAGWAIIPDELGMPETLENYPFGEITVENLDGTPTVTSWTPLPIPEPEPGPEPGPEPELPASLETRVEALETETAAISAAIERGLSL